MLDEKTLNLLAQYKFLAAYDAARAGQEDLRLLAALARTFGNPGHIMGGEMRTIVAAAVSTLLPEGYEDNDI